MLRALSVNLRPTTMVIAQELWELVNTITGRTESENPLNHSQAKVYALVDDSFSFEIKFKLNEMTQLRTTGPLTGNSQQTVDTFRKKIENYSFLLSDRIGKGFSSTVYRGINELTST